MDKHGHNFAIFSQATGQTWNHTSAYHLSTLEQRNRSPFKEWGNGLLQEENDSFIDNANAQILNLISESKKR